MKHHQLSRKFTSVGCVCRMSLKPRPESQSPGLARYNLAAAVYVQRLPVVSADCSPRAALQRHDGPDRVGEEFVIGP
ncbi:unnamed protein product [Knipowitschia caucasica]